MAECCPIAAKYDNVCFTSVKRLSIVSEADAQYKSILMQLNPST